MKLPFNINIFAYLFLCITVISCDATTAIHNKHITWTECGGEMGSHACNFTLMDQEGDDWSLYDHYGSVIILDFSAMWCGYCQKAATVAQDIQDKYKDDDVIWVTILLQNNYGQTPTIENLVEWSTAFDMSSAPVLSGNSGMIDPSAQNGYNVRTWPGFVIIDRDMIITYELLGWNEWVIQAEINKLLDTSIHTP